jgi:hypothetical protein
MNNQQQNKQQTKSKTRVRRKAAVSTALVVYKPPQPRSNPQKQRITAPVAITTVQKTRNPEITDRQKNGNVTVTHRELIGDIAGSVPFTVNQFSINPGLASTFPWLSSMASLYESYIFDSLEFEYSTSSSSTSNGKVMAAVDYDAADPAPLTKVAMASYEGYTSCSPWHDFVQRSAKQSLSKSKSYYVRNGPLSANQDIKTYDVGNLFLCTQGNPDTSIVGELYVKYKVRLMTPQLITTGVGTSLSSRFNLTTGAQPVMAAGSSAPITATGLTGGAVTFTASAPYNGLLTLSGFVTGSPTAVDTTGSTCTIQTPTFSASSTTFNSNAQVAMLPGQTYVYTLANQGATTMQIGQYNTLVL